MSANYVVITREKRVIQYSRGGSDESKSRGVLDTPLARGMKASGGGAKRRNNPEPVIPGDANGSAQSAAR